MNDPRLNLEGPWRYFADWLCKCFTKTLETLNFNVKLESSEPLDVNVINTTDITDVITAAIEAQTTDLTDKLQEICDTLDLGIDVNATQSGTWRFTVDGQPLSVALTSQNIADLTADLEAAELNVNIAGQDADLNVNITNDPFEVVVDFQDLIDFLQTIIRVDFESTHLCILDSDGEKVPLTGVFTERSYDFQGNPVDAGQLVLSQVVNGEWQTYTLGSGEVIGECPSEEERPTRECVETQEETFAIDNGFLNPSDTGVISILLDTGEILEVPQTPSAGFVAQASQWAVNIQTAALDAGYNWIVDLRYVNNADPSDISGLESIPGPDTVGISENLDVDGIGSRYVNIQTCFGEVKPVSATVTGGDIVDVPLITSGPHLGPLRSYYRCASCGESPTWYLQDGVTSVTGDDIPNCYVPCGTIATVRAIESSSGSAITQVHERVTGTEVDSIPTGLKTLTIQAVGGATIDGFPIAAGASYSEGASELDSVRAVLPQPVMTGTYRWIGLLAVVES